MRKLTDTIAATQPSTMWTFKVIVVCFGALFSMAHLLWEVYSLRFYTARDDWLAAAGKVVPGLAGLLVVAAALLAPSGWSVLCAVLTVPLMIISRAGYELIVFCKRGGDSAAH